MILSHPAKLIPGPGWRCPSLFAVVIDVALRSVKKKQGRSSRLVDKAPSNYLVGLMD